MEKPNNQHRQPEAQGGQALDALMSVIFAVIAAGFAAKGIQGIREHIPEAKQAAGGLGFAALMLTGVSIACAYRYNGPRS